MTQLVSARRERRDADRGRALPALARAVRDAVRPRPHAPADDRARSSRARVRVDPRRRDQRQVLDGPDDRRDPRPPRSARPAPTCRRTWSRSASGSGSATRDLEPAAFAAAVQRAARGGRARRPLGWPATDRVTQFEALTAAAYSELARREVEVAVIEAGLGGRYDATNVIPSKVQVLTSVGLEHTRWLGPTIDRHRGREARRRPGRRDARARRRPATRRGARRRRAWPRSAARGSSTRASIRASTSARSGAFQRRNFALARAAAEAFLGQLDERRGARAAGGRGPRAGSPAGWSATEPLTLLDGAHNPDGMRALVESLPEIVAGHDRLVGGRLDPRRQGRGRDARRRCCRPAMRSSSPPARIRAPCLRRRCSRSPPSSAAASSEIVPDPAARRSRAAASWPVRTAS